MQLWRAIRPSVAWPVRRQTHGYLPSRVQCRVKVGAIDTAARGTFKKEAHGLRREDEKSLLYFGCEYSGWYNFRESH